MFEAFFNFTRTPFARDMPPDSLYVTPQLDSLRSRLAHCVKNRSFLIVTGDSGSGKTTAIRHFIAALDPSRTAVLYVSEFNLTPRNFYFDLLNQLGVKPLFFRGDAKRQFVKEILIISADHKQPIIIIDEAHLCDMEMLTETCNECECLFADRQIGYSHAVHANQLTFPAQLQHGLPFTHGSHSRWPNRNSRHSQAPNL